MSGTKDINIMFNKFRTKGNDVIKKMIVIVLLILCILIWIFAQEISERIDEKILKRIVQIWDEESNLKGVENE